jgi:hypothetical protein
MRILLDETHNARPDSVAAGVYDTAALFHNPGKKQDDKR